MKTGQDMFQQNLFGTAQILSFAMKHTEGDLIFIIKTAYGDNCQTIIIDNFITENRIAA